jgi:hypothetical protein
MNQGALCSRVQKFGQVNVNDKPVAVNDVGLSLHHRLVFDRLSQRFGPGFLQRATEAVQCHTFGVYIACCAMCGAAAESSLLAVATAKSGDEGATLAMYRAANGRRKVVDRVVSEIEAHEALARLLRFAQFATDNWGELTRP